MAKAFSSREREIIRNSMLSIGARLIRQKDMRQITVEEITSHADISKGSFYSFYSSREIFLWEVIKQEEKELVEKIREVCAQDLARKEKIRRIFYDFYLEEKCLVFYVSQEDIHYLMRKLPAELIDQDRQMGQQLIRSLLHMCRLGRKHELVELLISMLHTLQFVASKKAVKRETKDLLFEIMVESFSEYLDQQGDQYA